MILTKACKQLCSEEDNRALSWPARMFYTAKALICWYVLRRRCMRYLADSVTVAITSARGPIYVPGEPNQYTWTAFQVEIGVFTGWNSKHEREWL